MSHFLLKLGLCTSLTLFLIPSDALGGRGGGRGGFGGGGGGGMQRGGAGGMQRGGAGGMQRDGAGGMQRGGAGGMQRGGGGAGFGGGAGGMSHSPSFSQPRNPAGGPGAAGRNPYANNPNAGAAAGAGFANRNQDPNAGAAAGAGFANRNQNPDAGAAAAGAGFANRNQNPNAGAAAAGAGFANRNQNPNAGAAAAGAGFANRNQNQFSNAGAAAAGAAYSNRNQYDQFHPGMSYGYWNGNYGAAGLGAYAGMAMASGAYGYGSTPYVNPYAGGGGQVAAVDPQAANNGAGYDYSQPVDTSAAPPGDPPPADPNNSPIAQARQAFQGGDYDGALKLTQQALTQMPNDVTLHEFLGLIYFAQGKYDQAAAPLYAVLSVGPGWDWTTLISNYSDASVYTKQLRALESYVKANPKSAQAQFVLAYEYITQGQGESAVKHLQAVVALEPNDTVSAQLLSKLQPPKPGAAPDAPTPSIEPTRLAGVWTANAPPDATITLTLTDDANFTWVFAPKGKPPMTIHGTYAVGDGVLTLTGKDTPGGPLAGKIALPDETHMSFKAVAGPPADPGLQFARTPG